METMSKDMERLKKIVVKYEKSFRYSESVFCIVSNIFLNIVRDLVVRNQCESVRPLNDKEEKIVQQIIHR